MVLRKRGVPSGGATAAVLLVTRPLQEGNATPDETLRTMLDLINSLAQRVVGRILTGLVMATSATVSLYLVGASLEPLGRLLWDTRDADVGQLTFFNSKTHGGAYGLPVEVGDFNNDGQPDLVLAPMGASSGPGSNRTEGGEIYILRGDRHIDGVVNHADYTVETFPGLTIWGARSSDLLGTELFRADVNGDGFDDLLVGAQNYDGPKNDRPTCGGVFIILGGEDRLTDGSLIDLNYNPMAPPEGVITIIGERVGDRLGVWVHAGDLDRDGHDDLVLGADQSAGATVDGRARVGMVAVLYGRKEFPPLVDLSDGDTAGVSLLYGRDRQDHFGSTMEVADLDGDGFDEVIISAAINRLSADQDDIYNGNRIEGEALGGGNGPNNDRNNVGEVYVLFSDGPSRFPQRIDFARPLPPDLEERTGIIYGSISNSTTGEELAVADLDGNGHPELILGALAARVFKGVAYAIYDAAVLRGLTVDLDAIPDHVYVSEMQGKDRFSLFGDTMSVGDFNNDGIDDLAVGFPYTNTADSGSLAILLGQSKKFPRSFVPADLTPGDDIVVTIINGTDKADKFSYSMEVIDYNGDGYDDLFPNAMHGSGPANDRQFAGEAYLISGFHLTGQSLNVTDISPPIGPLGVEIQVTITGCGFTTTGDTRVFVGGAEALSIDVLSGSKLKALLPSRDSPATLPIRVETFHGTATLEDSFSYSEVSPFIRGDSDGNGRINISDPVRTLNYLSRNAVGSCLDRHDTNDDGTVDLLDPIATLEFLFRSNDPPEAPFPEPGIDETPDKLACP